MKILYIVMFISIIMDKRNYIVDIERILKERKKPIELLNIILGFLNFKPIEIKIYNLLLKSSLTIKQIEKKLNLSERTIRKYIKRLEQEGFINKKVKQDKRLKYIYNAVPIQEAWKNVRNKIQRILEEITKTIEKEAMFF